MTLDEQTCWARLATARHAVLATMHARRGVDAVPVVFGIVGHHLVVPIDTVKPKRGGRLQRLRNLERDGRCVLLADGYDEDWSLLWWVRVHGRGVETHPSKDVLAVLGKRYPQYRSGETIVSTITLTPTEISGWTADR